MTKTYRNAIICAACQSVSGEIITGHRHFDAVMRRKIARLGLTAKDFTRCQGFMDMYGNFVTREQAFLIFNGNNQHSAEADRGRGGKLYSENLY